MLREEVAEVAKALAHPARVQIVELLATQTECRGAEVFGVLPLAQSTISEHLRVLKDAGLVKSAAVGTAAVYCLDAGRLSEFADEVARLARSAAPCASEERC